MNREVSTVEFTDFSGGIDLRDGLITDKASICYDQLNCQITPGKKLKRRISCELLPGLVPTINTYLLDSQLTSFLPIVGGTPFSVVGLAVPSRIFRYDTPPFCEAEGVVIEAGSTSGIPVILVEHTATYDEDVKFLYLHVFDEPDAKTQFTYVSDGAPPCYWTPRLPQHPYGKDKPGSAKTYAPRMDMDGGRVGITLPNGDTAYSSVNRPRVFNERTADQILTEGRWWYILGSLEGTNTAQVSTPNEAGYLATTESFGVEVLANDGSWTRISSTTTEVLNLFYRTSITYTLTAGQAGRPVRFYVFSKPEAIILSGCNLQGNGTISAGTIQYKGATVPVPAIESPIFSGVHGSINYYYYGFNPVNFHYFRSATKPQDGTVIVAYCDFTAASAAFGSGTVTISGTTVTGTGTSFHTFFPVQPDGFFGYINFDSAGIRKVLTVPSDTSLTIDAPPRSSSGAFSYSRPSVPQVVLPGRYATYTGENAITSQGTSSLKANQLLNSRVTIGSEAKRVIGAGTIGSFSLIGMTMDSVYTTTNTSAIATYVPTYVYDYQFGDTGTETYANRVAEAILIAGDPDAGYFTSSQYAQEGTVPVAIAITQNRVFLQYDHAIQMWALGPAISPAFLSKQEIGAGANTFPDPQSVDDGVIFPTTFGPRMFLPSGNAKDYIDYVPFGDKLIGVELPVFQASAWWQEQSLFLTASRTEDDTVIWVMSYNKQNKVAAWGRWTIEGLTKIDRMMVGGGTLLILSNQRIYQFRPDSTEFKDKTGPFTFHNYTSSMRSLYTTLGKPRYNKRLTRLDLAQKGTSTFSVYANAGDLSDQVFPTDAPVVTGYTMGVTKVGLAAMAPAIGYGFSSTDETGHEIYSIGFDFILNKR